MLISAICMIFLVDYVFVTLLQMNLKEKAQDIFPVCLYFHLSYVF